MNKKTIYICLLVLSMCSVSIAQPLSDVYAPRVVGVPPSDAYIGLSRLADGEIRHYNYGEQKLEYTPYYLSSKDNGFTWTRVELSEEMPFADNASPVSGEYIRAFNALGKTYVVRTSGGPNGGRAITEIDNRAAIMLKPPVFVDGGKRVLIGAHYTDRKGCFTYVSTDDGASWQRSNVVNSPPHEKGGYHQGVRWNHGAVEPTVAEIGDGRLWMVMRTAQDRFYQSFSSDGGLNWSEPTPSPFYGTITMPTFQKLADGRLLFFWSNTTPLPEMQSATGVWDDVFTNRNAAHVAISEDDGRTWVGMRELYLDPRRNAEDYGTVSGVDKSVHQVQAVEVAPGKVLAAIGQHHLHRKMLLFDVDWIYEKGRECDFSDSLQQFSAFRYLKGIVGHCGYNREEMPVLVPHSDKQGAQMLNITYAADERFVEDNLGVSWNFPATHSGTLEMSLKMPDGSQKVDLVLIDRWFNPTDTVAKYEAQYSIPLSRENLKIKDDKWHEIRVVWDERGRAVLYNGSRKIGQYALKNSTQHGISYLQLVGGKTPDSVGLSIEYIKQNSK